MNEHSEIEGNNGIHQTSMLLSSKNVGRGRGRCGSAAGFRAKGFVYGLNLSKILEYCNFL